MGAGMVRTPGRRCCPRARSWLLGGGHDRRLARRHTRPA